MCDSIAIEEPKKELYDITLQDKDSWVSSNADLPSALYFYFLNSGLPNWGDAGSVLGNCPAIQSVQYVPFINIEDVNLGQVKYDVERFGSVDPNRPTLVSAPWVFRMNYHKTRLKKLGSFDSFTIPPPSIGGAKHWKNESRLHHYPYMFAMLSDNLNTPQEIKYHLCKYTRSEIMVRTTISDRCSYALFVKGYKGDNNGRLEAMVSGDAHELPCSSSAYSQWFAGSKNLVAQQTRQVIDNAFIQKEHSSKMMKPNTLNTINPRDMMGFITGNMANQINHATTVKQASNDKQHAINSVMATQKDLYSTPNTMISMGSDVYYGLENGTKKLILYRYGLQEQYYQRLGDYFAMFGYKRSQVMYPSFKSRYYFNYIRTIGVNIEGNKIPRSHLETLRGIFDNGVTVWHKSNNAVVGDYSRDNYEV